MTPEPKIPQQPETSTNDEHIISQDDFIKQYVNDTKIAADAVIDDKGNISINPATTEDIAAPPLSDSEAYENAETLMKVREGLQAVGLSLYVDGSIDEAENYEYPEKQFNKLVKAWTPIIQRAGLRVSPIWGVLVAEATCTGPLLALAYRARQQRIELEEAKRIIKANNEKISKLEKQEIIEVHERSPESQKKWALDNSGYFTYTASGVYIPVGKRSEKPNLKRDYALLCKHNGKDFIDKIFKIVE